MSALFGVPQAVPAFRKLVPDGKISINTNLAPFYVPLTNSSEDVVSLLQLPAFGTPAGPVLPAAAAAAARSPHNAC